MTDTLKRHPYTILCGPKIVLKLTKGGDGQGEDQKRVKSFSVTEDGSPIPKVETLLKREGDKGRQSFRITTMEVLSYV